MILGGGFGGLYTALALYWAGTCLSADVTLINREPTFLFTPLLYELITGEVEDWQIAPAFREILPSPIDFLEADIESVDLTKKEITFRANSAARMGFDILVLALGSETNHFGIPGAQTNSIPFRTISDALELKKRLEAPILDNRPVTVLGAGPSGVELAAKISDFLTSRLSDRQTTPEIILTDRSSEILPGYAADLREIAMAELRRRNVSVKLGSGVRNITSDRVELENGTAFPSGLTIWTAGSGPSPILQTLGCVLDRRGRIPVGNTLEIPGHPGMFVLGDCANPGDQIPATAQVAVRQAQIVARNVAARLSGNRYHEFHYTPLGEMLSLGQGVAAANLFGVKFSGAAGNTARRLIYLLTLPSPGHAFKVGFSWAGSALEDLLKGFD